VVDDAPRILGGRYEVGELIGRGGMAEVHIGHDTRLGRTVAIKILRSDLARDPSFQARFRREAQAAASLNHPAIVAVYDTGEDVSVEPSGNVAHVPFIVMEYVEGHTVRDILRDGAAVPIEEAVEITSGVLSALEYSHHAGIVHRDIKPANVMLTPTGAVKVMDFGIARAMADAAGTMTQTQAVIGTAQYLSPEQARGEQVDSRSDLYSTGCLLFELLTGRPPFVGDSPVAVAYQHARENPQPPSAFASDVPDTLDRITMKSLAKNREHRYPSAADFRSDLEAAVRGGHVGAPAVGAFGAAALGAGAGAAAAAVTSRMDSPGAATQVMRPTTTPPPVSPPPAAAGWAPLGADDTRGGGGTGQYQRDEEPTKRPWVLWLLVGVAIAAIVGIALLLTRGDPGGTEPTPVAVPDVVGLPEQEARDAIDEAGLEFVRQTEPSIDVPEGSVTRTDPAAEEEVDPGSDVSVWISSGADAVVVPEMKNYTRDQAQTELIGLGFDAANIDWQTEESPDVIKDSVTRTEPPAGDSVDPTGSITVFLSTGLVTLPNLAGKPEQEARDALTALRLVPIISREDSTTVAAGAVIRQSRSPGPVEQGASIEIVIAQEPVIEMTTVPADLVGMTCKQALDALGNAELNGECEAPDGTRADNNDIVSSSDPAPGTEVPVGSAVTLVAEPFVGPPED
jgi:serine/threonine-protein kinase